MMDSSLTRMNAVLRKGNGCLIAPSSLYTQTELVDILTENLHVSRMVERIRITFAGYGSQMTAPCQGDKAKGSRINVFLL